MTPERLAYRQREFLILNEKESALSIQAEFDRLKREMFRYFRQTFAAKSAAPRSRPLKNYVEQTLLLLDNQLERISIPVSNAVERAQRRMINFTGSSLKRYLPEIKSSIFEPDKEAIQKLVGRTQNGSSLQKFFRAMRQPLRIKAEENLIEGFNRGEGSEAIAKRIYDVADIGRYRALVVARNETVMAYRNASAEFYSEAGIEKYRFLSVLDPRTCLICWRLHGTIWRLKITPHIHTQCRCIVVPVLARDGKIKTGVEHFKALETGVQKQILGAKRFEFFAHGNALESFVGVKKSEDFGQTYFIKNLPDLFQS